MPISFPQAFVVFYFMFIVILSKFSTNRVSTSNDAPKNSQLSEVKHLSFTCFPSLYIDKPKRSFYASQVIFSVKMLYQAILKPWKITRRFRNNNKRK